MVVFRRKIWLSEGKHYPFNVCISDFSIKPHIDFVSISSIPSFYKPTIATILYANGFKLTNQPKLKEGKFERKLEFKDGQIKIDIFYGMRLSEFIKPTIYIKIHDPNLNILELFQMMFANLMIPHKLMEIELTFDFYTDDVFGLQDFINKHLFLRYQNQRLPSYKYEDSLDEGETFYTTGRKAAKRTRTYTKLIDGKIVLRLELILSKVIIKRIGLKLPLESIDTLDITKYITFMYVDTKKLVKYLKKSEKEEIKSAYSKRWLSGRLYEKHIETWVKSMVDWELMRQVEQLKKKDEETGFLKGVPNFSRFLIDYQELIQKFRKELAGKSFIPRGDKLYYLIYQESPTLQ